MKYSRSVFAVVALLLALEASADFDEPKFGEATATCDIEALKCFLNWNLANSSKHYFIVQRYVPTMKEWMNVREPISAAPVGTAKRAMREGQLHRVIGCDSQEVSASCIGTTVVWAPIINRQLEDIPAVVESVDGAQMFINRNEGLASQLLSLNVYQFVQRFQLVNLGKLPPMTPRSPDDRPVKTADIIHVNVYSNYRGARNNALGIEMPVEPEHSDARPGPCEDAQ